MPPSSPLRRLVTAVWGRWQTKAPWQRIAKDSVACAVALVIAILPHLKAKPTFLSVMVTVFAPPGQRMGVVIESLLMILLGSLLGLSWSLLGLHLSSLVQETNPPAAYTIRGLFLLVCVLFHGYVRSSSPRLFNFVLFLLVASLLTIQLPATATASLYTTIYVPILIGGGVSMVVNLCIFPELSSSYLGSSTIDTLAETVDTLARATHWFITPGCDSDEARDRKHGRGLSPNNESSREAPDQSRFAAKGRRLGKFLSAFPNPFQKARSRSSFASFPLHLTTLAHLTEQKPKLRAQLSRCKVAQEEVNFEISLSPLSPIAMKPISKRYLAGLVQNIVTLIGACENKFIVVDKHNNVGGSSMDKETPEPASVPPQPTGATKTKRKKKKWGCHSDRVEGVRPVKEIEACNARLLESTLAQIRDPVQELQAPLTEAIHLVISCLGYCFDVPKLPSGAPAPKGVPLEEIDVRIDQFANSLALFDSKSAEALKRAAMDQSDQPVDFLPRMETFLVSSFILALRDAAAHVSEMLRHTRHLVETRQHRHDRARLWMPRHTSLGQWLSTGEAARSDQGSRAVAMSRRGQGLPGTEEPAAKRTVDEESSLGQSQPEQGNKEDTAAGPGRRSRRKAKPRELGWAMKTRAKAADVIEWARGSDDVDHALKLAVALFLVTWPALVESLNAWYTEVRGIWAPLQLVLVFEVSIGTSLLFFAVRLFGVVFGCVVGYLAGEIGRDNRIAVVAVLLVGILPSVYVQVATKYVKAGMMSTVSMVIVALSAVNTSYTAYEVLYRRLVAFLVGGLVAMLVEIGIAPVRARDRLVESLSASVRQVQKMQGAVGVGIDGPESPNLRSHALLASFNHARDKAQSGLSAAETFLPFCLSEPRLKGSFKPLAPIYQEIIYVLHQVIDHMDNVVQLRRAYGSSILEDLNPKVYAYRRSVAASNTLILFSVNEALTTSLPLPQFIPSARLALLRLINHVRDVVMSESAGKSPATLVEKLAQKAELDEETAKLITRRKFLSWNASTAGLMEIIEYLEELVELAKLLVGVNAFRSGMLEGPIYRHYTRQGETSSGALTKVLSVSRPEGDPGVGAQLGRAATLPLRSETVAESQSRTGGDRGDGGGESDNDGGIPRSLQRVGTRLREGHAGFRRRALTVGDGRA